MSLTSSQRQRLVDNLTSWRRDRLVVEGKRPLGSVDTSAMLRSHFDAIVYGVSAYVVTWQQRPKTDEELAFELFPRPGLVWAPTLRRVDPRQIVLDSDGKLV